MQPVELTRKFLLSLEPPKKGELWIPDARVRGFGVRLWSTRSGGQAAFAIRARDSNGIVRRKTFDPRPYKENWGEPDNRQLGDFLNHARNWARDEISELKGRPTRAERRMLRWQRARDRVRSLTLGQAAQQLLDNMRARNLSQSYRDRQDKLFNALIPRELRDANVVLVQPKAVAAALVRRDIPPGNIRVLRSFIGQIYKHLAKADGTMLRFPQALSEVFWKRWDTLYDVPFPQLRNLKPEDYRQVFKLLEIDDNWQQALCIRLFFEFGSALTRLMAAQWSQILNGHWYPYWPGERVLWFEGRQQIKGDIRALLERITFLVRRDWHSRILVPFALRPLFKAHPDYRSHMAAHFASSWQSALSATRVRAQLSKSK